MTGVTYSVTTSMYANGMGETELFLVRGAIARGPIG